MADYWLPRSLGRSPGTANLVAGLLARGANDNGAEQNQRMIVSKLRSWEPQSSKGRRATTPAMSKEVADPAATLLPLHDAQETTEGDDLRRRELMTKVLQHTLVVRLGPTCLFDVHAVGESTQSQHGGGETVVQPSYFPVCPRLASRRLGRSGSWNCWRQYLEKYREHKLAPPDCRTGSLLRSSPVEFNSTVIAIGVSCFGGAASANWLLCRKGFAERMEMTENWKRALILKGRQSMRPFSCSQDQMEKRNLLDKASARPQAPHAAWPPADS